VENLGTRSREGIVSKEPWGEKINTGGGALSQVGDLAGEWWCGIIAFCRDGERPKLFESERFCCSLPARAMLKVTHHLWNFAAAPGKDYAVESVASRWPSDGDGPALSACWK